MVKVGEQALKEPWYGLQCGVSSETLEPVL